MKLFMPYKYGSESAKALRDITGIKFIKKTSNRQLTNCTIINWGCSTADNRVSDSCNIINKPEAVRKTSNKLSTLFSLKDRVLVPPFTENRSEARLMASRGIVVARTILNGHSGQGIQIIPKGSEDIPDAPLYVQYIKKKKEFRVHVFDNEVIFVQEKRRRRDIPDDQVNWQIRNHSNGFIFAHNDLEYDDVMLSSSIDAVNALGLDFGAVDIIYNQRENKYYVLEVNTAPGLTGETLRVYADKFMNI